MNEKHLTVLRAWSMEKQATGATCPGAMIRSRGMGRGLGLGGGMGPRGIPVGLKAAPPVDDDESKSKKKKGKKKDVDDKKEATTVDKKAVDEARAALTAFEASRVREKTVATLNKLAAMRRSTAMTLRGLGIGAGTTLGGAGGAALGHTVGQKITQDKDKQALVGLLGMLLGGAGGMYLGHKLTNFKDVEPMDRAVALDSLLDASRGQGPLDVSSLSPEELEFLKSFGKQELGERMPELIGGKEAAAKPLTADARDAKTKTVGKQEQATEIPQLVADETIKAVPKKKPEKPSENEVEYKKAALAAMGFSVPPPASFQRDTGLPRRDGGKSVRRQQIFDELSGWSLGKE